MFVVVGPNGSGKSTFLKAAAGVIPQMAGSVVMDGEDVDDNPNLCDALKWTEYEGIATQTSNGGRAAWALLSQSRFDVVVSDVRMPDGDGVELLKRLRDSGDHTPFLLMTGFATFNAEQAAGLGASGFLRKPFELEHFVATVRSVAQRRGYLEDHACDSRSALPAHRVHGLAAPRQRRGRRVGFSGLPMSYAECKRTKSGMDWSTFVELLRRIEAALGGEKPTMNAIRRASGRSEGTGKFTAIASYFASARQVYRGVIRWLGPAMFPFVHFTFEDISDNQLRIGLSLPDGLVDSPQLFRFWQAGFIMTPKVVGQAEALVELERTPRGASFLITLPPSFTLRARVGRAIRVFGGAREATSRS